MATVCRWPPDSAAIGMRTEGILADRVRSSRQASFSMPTSSMIGPSLCSCPRNRLATTSRLSHSARSWKTVAMPSACAWLGPPTWTCASVERDVAGVGLVDPGDHLDQRGLAGAVVADERHHLAGAGPRDARR